VDRSQVDAGQFQPVDPGELSDLYDRDWSEIRLPLAEPEDDDEGMEALFDDESTDDSRAEWEDML
jgi:hypothetical protein